MGAASRLSASRRAMSRTATSRSSRASATSTTVRDSGMGDTSISSASRSTGSAHHSNSPAETSITPIPPGRPTAGIWRVSPTGPRRPTLPTSLTTGSIGPSSSPTWSPDGRAIAYYGHDNACMNATNTDVWIASAGGGDPVNLTAAADRSFEHHIITDMRAHPEIGGPVWSADGQRIFAIVAEGAMNQLAAVDARGAGVTVLISGRREIFGLAIGGSGDRAVVAASDPATPGDLWVVPLDGRAAERRLTQVNQAILDQVILSVPERFTYQGADDWPVEGWVMRPVEFRDGARYPTVLQIHGGPHGAYGE